jgi:hypothetical protein
VLFFLQEATGDLLLLEDGGRLLQQLTLVVLIQADDSGARLSIRQDRALRTRLQFVDATVRRLTITGRSSLPS